MRKLIFTVAAVAALTAAPTASAFDLKDLLGGGDVAGTVSNVLDNVFSTSNIDVRDLAGVWTSTGSAVAFKSDDLLAKAGGVAASSTVQNKLDPYFQKYGLTGAVFTIETDGNFTLQIKSAKLQGTIEKKEDGNFTFKFQAFGQINLGHINAYVEKSTGSMSIMFDASKLKSIFAAASKISGNKLATSAIGILNSYKDIYIGFKLQKTGTVQGEGQQQPTEDGQSQGAKSLFDLLKK